MDMYLEFRLHLIIDRFILLFLLLLGTFGNITVLVVLSRPRNFKHSTARLMLALAVSDLLTLWLVIPYRWIDSMYGFNIREYSEVLCKLHMILTFGTGEISMLFIVVLNIERLIAILRPLKMKRYCSLRNINTAIKAIPFISLTFSGHMLYAISINENGKCSKNEDLYDQWIWWVWLKMNVVFIGFGSFMIVLVVNLCIFTKLVKHNRLRLGMKNKRETKAQANKEKMSKIYFTLILVTISFMICYIPMGIYTFTQSGEHLADGSTYEDAKTLLFFTASSAFTLMSNVSNFFIYFLRGLKFRKEVKDLFCKTNKN